MIKATINTILLFLAASLFPIVSFILPAYKIKNMPKLNSKERLLSTIISAVVIGVIDFKLLFVYIGIFLLIEGLYYIFDRTAIKVFDRILISTTLTTIVTYILMRVFIGTASEMIASMRSLYENYMTSIDPQILKMTFDYMGEHLIFVMFTYLLVINYFTYFIVKGRSYRKWSISYLWLLFYIITFFIDNTLGINNFYVKNLYSISTLIYTIYGAKVLYSILRTKIKWKLYVQVLSIMTAFFFPIGIFILGALNSFELIKIVIRRK